MYHSEENVLKVSHREVNSQYIQTSSYKTIL